jgi:putative transposase
VKRDMNWKKLLGSIRESVDEELRLRNAYLAAENRILRQQIPGRVQLSASDRKALAKLGQQLGKQALDEVATIAQPGTILAWHRKCMDQQHAHALQRQSVGRPRIDKEIEDLAVRMACENRSRGYDRIVGALANLGYTISDQTVGNILKRHSIPPAPQRTKTLTWQEFIRIPLAILRATDFFRSAVWSWFALVLSALLSVLHGSRHWAHAASVAAYHNAQRFLPLLPWSLEGHADEQREGHVSKVGVRSQLILRAGGIQREAFSVALRPADRVPRSHSRGKVVLMPVRHGPMQRRRELRPSDDYEAA